MQLKKFAIIAFAAFMAVSCASEYEKVMRSHDVDLKYKAAHNYFNQGKYKKAADIFDNLNLLVQGLPQEDTVIFYHVHFFLSLPPFFMGEARCVCRGLGEEMWGLAIS